jgi:acyl carrier protein
MTIDNLQEIFRAVFDKKDLVISADTSAKDIKSWDSLTHLELIASVEEAFNIKFSFSEVMQFNTVGDMINAIEKNTSNK